MSKKGTSLTMVTRNKVMSCSTPEHRQDSPARDDDSLCESEAGSPVPFLCTQDGAEGETDVVWNFYTPKADAPTSRLKNSTPLSRKKKTVKPKLTEMIIPRRKPINRITQKNTNELFQDLIELNQNLHELIAKKAQSKTEKQQSGSEEDIFNVSGDSPKSIKGSSRCLRRNLLSSKFAKPDVEPETALESDDSMNECLIKASQVVEENILNEPTPPKRNCFRPEKIITTKPNMSFKMNHDSMDAILNSINLESPLTRNKKRFESPKIHNDSFDNIFENMNDSALERLTQIPIKNNASNKSKLNVSKDDWTVQELVVHDSSPSSKSFFRHNSMPESPSIPELNRPSTSGMAFGRYKSMPVNDNNVKPVPGDSPIQCTPDEIKRKHQQAREKLLAKRQLPFTSTQSSIQNSQAQPPAKRNLFQPKVPSVSASNIKNRNPVISMSQSMKCNMNQSNNVPDMKTLIEKKRQEALMKLRKRHAQK